MGDVVYYCDPNIFCVSFFYEGLAMESVWISIDWLLPGNSHDRASCTRRELHQPVSLPPLLSFIKVFLGVLSVVFCSEGEVYDGIIIKYSANCVCILDIIF